MGAPLFVCIDSLMTRASKSILMVLLLTAFSARAFVPVGMMLDVRSYLMGGDLVTICSSAGDLPWRLVEFDHDDNTMDQMPESRCPYAALDAPASVGGMQAPALIIHGHAFYSALETDLFKSLIERRAARAPPV